MTGAVGVRGEPPTQLPEARSKASRSLTLPLAMQLQIRELTSGLALGLAFYPGSQSHDDAPVEVIVDPVRAALA